MNEPDNRHVSRDSLFLMAELRLDGFEGEYRIKVRNLSAGGMMGEGPLKVMRGAIVRVNIRNIGWVEGSIAWVQDSRFGVAFSEDIDPLLARASKVEVESPEPLYTRNLVSPSASPGKIRKI